MNCFTYKDNTRSGNRNIKSAHYNCKYTYI